MNKKNVIFDWDGTLADTRRRQFAFYQDIASQLGKKPFASYEAFCDVEAQSSTDWMVVYKYLGLDAEQIKEADQLYPQYLMDTAGQVKLFDGIDHMLEQLRKLGIEVGIVSGNYSESITKALQSNGVQVAHVVGYEFRYRKPDPRALQACLNRFRSGSISNTALVGDTRKDIDAAKLSGMDCLVATWGYEPIEMLVAHDPQARLLERPSEIIPLVSDPGAELEM